MRWVLTGILCLSLLGCGLINPRPPRAVVESAIAQKLSRTQAVLYRQFDSAPADRAEVGRIRITEHRWTELAGQPAVEVAGTYHLRGGRLTSAQRSQTRDFEVYLQRGATKDQWQLLEPISAQSGNGLKWQAIPLVTGGENQPHPS
ncbi:hypothetical protein PGN35_022535 [Nodosilinea sp. PGN35]|uniref:hypothetical protein n=1 Tax=Nodosilinea sp. PGN35 TaxID=3020489 RepID=UPI0023B31B0C|nr:hypothetical protein [Nodosilinea sp. TSF1-S3]MDF0367502.1 hypothetical protein [Nodosilinea sp. TSF1-S3]